MSSFKKRSYPSFAGNILNYYKFKQRWSDEVIPERLMEIQELNNLKDQIPQLGQTNLSEV